MQKCLIVILVLLLHGAATKSIQATLILHIALHTKMQQMESVLASVLPANISSWDEYQKELAEEPDFIIEEIEGKVYPTEAMTGETGESFTAETMSSDLAESDIHPEAENTSESEASELAIQETEQSAESETPQNLVGMGKESGQGDSSGENTVAVDYEAAKANGYRIYVVGEGETLYGICWKTYDSLNHLKEICQLNNLQDVDKILAGQRLILP